MARLSPGVRRRQHWLIVGSAGFIILVVIVVARCTSTSPPQQIAPDTRMFTVDGAPTLVFAHTIGSVHITPGVDGQVRIQEQRNGITSAISIHYVQRGDAITVTADIPSGLYLATWVVFNVSVPPGIGLNISVPTGTLTADDLSGQIILKDTDGSIWATGLVGTMILQSQSGSINANHVRGQLIATTGNGTITTTDTHLSGQSAMRAQSGTIDFNGSLDRAGRFMFSNTNGAVSLTLPPSAAFRLDAHTQGGSIIAEYAGIRDARTRGGTEAEGNVGSAPRPLVIIQTTSGSIDVHHMTAGNVS
jgi:hypothetical protein